MANEIGFKVHALESIRLCFTAPSSIASISNVSCADALLQCCLDRIKKLALTNRRVGTFQCGVVPTAGSACFDTELRRPSQMKDISLQEAYAANVPFWPRTVAQLLLARN